MLHPYKKKEIDECFEDKAVVFIGDSTTRQLFCMRVLVKL